MVDKDTELYCSFSKKAGSKGCKYFNTAFKYHGLNAIYKSFSVESIKESVEAARCLGISGFAVSMPFKKEVLEYVDEASRDAAKIGAANTVLNKNGKLIAYNTDCLAAEEFLERKNRDKVVILGNGGYAAAVKHAAQKLNLKQRVVTRSNWNQIYELKNTLVFNCTPVENVELDETNDYIDCMVYTKTGRELGLLQASHQFKLYTGLDFPVDLFGEK